VNASLDAAAMRATRARVAPWLAWSLAGLAGGLAWSALGAWAHATDAEPVCLLRRVTHLACPTCGMTRAMALLAHGEWRAAFALHPWAPALAAQIVAAWALWGVALARADGRRLDRWLPHAVALNLGVLMLLWLVRLATATLPAV